MFVAFVQRQKSNKLADMQDDLWLYRIKLAKIRYIEFSLFEKKHSAALILSDGSEHLFNKSIDLSETIIFPMDHQRLRAAGSNRYS